MTRYADRSQCDHDAQHEGRAAGPDRRLGDGRTFASGGDAADMHCNSVLLLRVVTRE